MKKHTLKLSIFAAALVALSLPVVAAAQWGNRYPDNRNDGRYGRYDERALKDSVQRLDRLSKDFEKDVDRALDHSRVNGSSREDRINDQVHRFRSSVGDLKSHVGNGRDLNRSAEQARRVLQEGQQLDRFIGSRGLDSRVSSEWYSIQRELQFIGDVYGFRYDGGYGGRNDGRGNNNDWWRRIPFPR
jgi:hypothetical protein